MANVEGSGNEGPCNSPVVGINAAQNAEMRAMRVEVKIVFAIKNVIIISKKEKNKPTVNIDNNVSLSDTIANEDINVGNPLG